MRGLASLLVLGVGCRGDVGDSAAGRPVETVLAATGWRPLPLSDDPWAAERPSGVECLPVGYDVEGDFFEVETDYCPWGVFGQEVQADVAAGERLRFVFWHSELWAREPAEGRVEIQVGGRSAWAERRAIPGPDQVDELEFAAPFALAQGDRAALLVTNHGLNAWRVGSWTVGGR